MSFKLKNIVLFIKIYIYITFEENSEYYTSEDDIDMIDVIVFAKL